MFEAMNDTGYVLEAQNLFYSAKVLGGDGVFHQKDKGALILKGINFMVYSTEVMAILGSKGSGKKALLDAISHRADGKVKGNVMLNGTPLTKKLFQQKCGYVTNNDTFVHGLTIQQTLHYNAIKIPGPLKYTKIRQILADLAISQIANKRVDNLTVSEKRRLSIGVQLVKYPVMLLLDEPTQDLDPLSAYLLISILSNSAKKQGYGVILSMEKPRSDIFPFLDRALFLCLGGVVYSGGTRAMLEYFHGIGFPCPQLENPLMYYLCLSTVDRRSRDRFLESSQQIDALIDKFHQTYIEEVPVNMPIRKLSAEHEGPGAFKSVWNLYLKILAVTFSFGTVGLKTIFYRLFFLPIAVALLWIYYSAINVQSTNFYSRNGFILNLLGISYGMGLIVTSALYFVWKRDLSKAQMEGTYSAGGLLVAYTAISLPFSLISSAIAASVIYPLILPAHDPNATHFLYIFISIWSSYMIAEQLCIFFTTFIDVKGTIQCVVSFIISISLILSSGTVHAYKSLQTWLQGTTVVFHPKYTSILMHSAVLSPTYKYCNKLQENSICNTTTTYVQDRLGVTIHQEIFALDTVLVAILFPICFCILNTMIYWIVAPTFSKPKSKN